MEIIQMKYDNNPNYIMDQILHYELKKKNKYPDMSTVVNDPLRPQLQKYLGINLSMCDTHSYILGNYQGICTNDKYFIYVAPIEELRKILPKSCYNTETGELFSYVYEVPWFPEGVFLGFMPTEFINDDEFRNSHLKMYYSFIETMYYYMIEYMNDKHYFHFDLLCGYSFFFKCRNCLNCNITDFPIFDVDNDIDSGSVDITEVKENEKEFRAVYSTYNYADYVQFTRNHLKDTVEGGLL